MDQQSRTGKQAAIFRCLHQRKTPFGMEKHVAEIIAGKRCGRCVIMDSGFFFNIQQRSQIGFAATAGKRSFIFGIACGTEFHIIYPI